MNRKRMMAGLALVWLGALALVFGGRPEVARADVALSPFPLLGSQGAQVALVVCVVAVVAIIVGAVFITRARRRRRRSEPGDDR